MQPTARQPLCIPMRNPENRDGSVLNAGIEGESSEKREEAGALGKLFKQVGEAWERAVIYTILFLNILSISYSYSHSYEIYPLWA